MSISDLAKVHLDAVMQSIVALYDNNPSDCSKLDNLRAKVRGDGSSTGSYRFISFCMRILVSKNVKSTRAPSTTLWCIDLSCNIMCMIAGQWHSNCSDTLHNWHVVPCRLIIQHMLMPCHVVWHKCAHACLNCIYCCRYSLTALLAACATVH